MASPWNRHCANCIGALAFPMLVLTAARTLQVDLERRGKGREGRRENIGKCKMMRNRRGEGKTKEERRLRREEQIERREKGREGWREKKREKAGAFPQFYTLSTVWKTYFVAYWLIFFLKSPQQRTCLKFGERSFSCAGPRACNSLPSGLSDTNTFIRQLKYFFF